MSEMKEKIEVKTYGDLIGILNNIGLSRLLKCKLMPIKVTFSLNRFVNALKSTAAVQTIFEMQKEIQSKIVELSNDESGKKEAQKLNKEFNDALSKKLEGDENAVIDIDKAIIKLSDIPTPEDTKKYFIDLESSKKDIECECGKKVKISSFDWLDQIIDGEVVANTSHFIDWQD